MAIFGMGVVLAPAIGPILGGWLTDRYGWPAIFYINVPVGLFGLFMGRLLQAAVARQRERLADASGLMDPGFSLSSSSSVISE